MGHKQIDMLILPIELLKTNNSRERKEREFFSTKNRLNFSRWIKRILVNDPNFINVKITTASDLELYWRVYTYNDESE